MSEAPRAPAPPTAPPPHAEDLSVVIRSQCKVLGDALERLEATAAGSRARGNLVGAFGSHVDRAVSTIVAAGGGEAERLVRGMLDVLLLEAIAIRAQQGTTQTE